MPTRVYLDTNIYQRLVDGPKGDRTPLQARAVLVDAIRQRRVQVIGSLYHIEELSRIRPDVRREQLACFSELVGRRLMLPVEDVAAAEVRLRRPLRRHEVYVSFDDRLKIRQGCLDDELLSKIAEHVAQTAADHAQRLEALRDRSRRRITQIAEVKPHAGLRKWWQQHDQEISEWIRDGLRTNRGRWSLPECESLWPEPGQIPTVAAVFAYQMRRIVENVGEGNRIQNSDRHDAFHYASAAGWADFLVTEDGPFRSTIAHLPPYRPLSVCDFSEFLRRLPALT